jgi:hypothetical protein
VYNSQKSLETPFLLRPGDLLGDFIMGEENCFYLSTDDETN